MDRLFHLKEALIQKITGINDNHFSVNYLKQLKRSDGNQHMHDSSDLNTIL